MKQLILSSLILFFLCGCDKDPFPPLTPTIITRNASNVMNTTATVSLSLNNISNSKEVGVFCSTSLIGLSSADTQKWSAENIKSGENTVSLTGLMPGTIYYYKAYATDGYVCISGDMKSFVTGIDFPTLTTNSINSITSNMATCGGNITSNGGGSVNTRGVCWNTSSSPTVNLSTKTVDGTGIGSFSSTITGLQPETTYYVRAYATNEKGTAYGAQVTVTTLPISIPTITTTSVSSITTTIATSGGNITDDGGATVTARGVCWSTSSSPTITDSKTSNGTGTGAFTSSITGLVANATYYVRAYAINSAGTAYGSEVSFKAIDTETKNGYTLTQNETWSGNILLKGDIIVPSGITLTINPGTIINISADSPLYDEGGFETGKVDFDIYGGLVINGTAQNIVQLKSAANSPTNNDWEGIRMLGNRFEITYCCISDSRYGVFCGESSTTAMKIKNCLFYNMSSAIVDCGNLQHTLSYDSFINIDYGYVLYISSRNQQIDYSEFVNGYYGIFIGTITNYGTNNSSISVKYSNFSGIKGYYLYWSSGGGVTNSNITANNCYGITTYLINGNGNTYTYTNQLTAPYSGAGCGFSSMARSPASRSSVISRNPEQVKRMLQEHKEEVMQQYAKMKHQRTY